VGVVHTQRLEAGNLEDVLGKLARDHIKGKQETLTILPLWVPTICRASR